MYCLWNKKIVKDNQVSFKISKGAEHTDYTDYVQEIITFAPMTKNIQ